MASAAARRRQHAGAGEWAAVSGAGAWRVEAAGKHQMMRRTGLPARDLRALDPALSYPASIMGRDRAVVVNLERVRAVITAAEVLVPAPRDPAVAPLVRELRARLAASPAPPQVSLVSAFATSVFLGRFLDCLLKKVFFLRWKEDGGALPPRRGGGGGGDGKDVQAFGTVKTLPFEFKALEVCLEFACKSLEQEVRPAACPW
jgi:magnesium transporter